MAVWNPAMRYKINGGSETFRYKNSSKQVHVHGWQLPVSSGSTLQIVLGGYEVQYIQRYIITCS